PPPVVGWRDDNFYAQPDGYSADSRLYSQMVCLPASGGCRAIAAGPDWRADQRYFRVLLFTCNRQDVAGTRPRRGTGTLPAGNCNRALCCRYNHYRYPPLCCHAPCRDGYDGSDEVATDVERAGRKVRLSSSKPEPVSACHSPTETIFVTALRT